MSRPVGSKNRRPTETKDLIERAFRRVNGPDGDGLIALSREHPAIFWGLVAKILPSQAAVAVTHSVVSLGDAMEVASARLADMQARMTIDMEPIDVPLLAESMVMPDEDARESALFDDVSSRKL